MSRISDGAPLSSADKNAILLTLEKDLRENYVFPDVASRLAEDLAERQNNGEYNSVTDGKAFAALLKDELQKVGHDKHLGVEYPHEARFRQSVCISVANARGNGETTACGAAQELLLPEGRAAGRQHRIHGCSVL